MPITERQRQERRKHMGSTDLVKVLGLSRFGTAYDVYLEKTGQLTPEIDLAVRQPRRVGRITEDGVLAEAEIELGRLVLNQYRARPEFHLGCHIDAITMETHQQEPVEAKTVGIFYYIPEGWGESGTDQVPDDVVVQSHAHMAAMTKNGRAPQICHVPVLMGGKGFRMYHVPRHKELIEFVCRKSKEFWENHVLKMLPPSGVLPSLDVVQRVRRVPEKTVELEPEIIQRWLTARRCVTFAKKEQDEAAAAVHAALGDAEAGDAGGFGSVTYYETKRKGYTVEPSVCRTLRYQKV